MYDLHTYEYDYERVLVFDHIGYCAEEPLDKFARLGEPPREQRMRIDL